MVLCAVILPACLALASSLPDIDGYWKRSAMHDSHYGNLVDYSGNGPCYSPGVAYDSSNNTANWSKPAGGLLPGYSTVLKLQCDLDPQCEAFAVSNPMLLSFSLACVARTDATAYISKTACGGSLGCAPSIEPPVQSGPSNHSYATCQCYGWSNIGTFPLPPTLLKQACDDNPRCSFFVALNNQTGGALWGCTAYGGSTSIKILN
jgi:hypothetical protein